MLESVNTHPNLHLLPLLRRYYAPHLAKLMLAQGGEGGSMEVYQPEMIGFSRYFASCFGQKKTSGTETDHCEQVIP